MLQPKSSLKIGQAVESNQIQGARITLSVSYNQKDWGAMQEWITRACGRVEEPLFTRFILKLFIQKQYFKHLCNAFSQNNRSI